MPLLQSMESYQNPILNLFYILDTSGSMRGEPISMLNRAMLDTIDAIRMEAEANSNAVIKISVLEFNTNCRWLSPSGAETLEDFEWNDLSAGGYTYMGSALKELGRKLTRKPGGFLGSMSGTFTPVFIFMTDGFANDDYEPALHDLLMNKWFAKGTRVGFAIGKNPDTQMIAKLAGSSEAVIRTRDLGLFAQLLRWVSVSATTLASRTHTRGDTASGSAVMDDVYSRHVDVNRSDVSAGFTYCADESNSSTDSFFVNEDEFDTSNPF